MVPESTVVRQRRGLFVAAALLNLLLLWHFHDRFWYPTDDGLYAHVAERLMNGEVLNRDIQDIHPGYIHFVDAAAFRMFGVDLVSLRYPLVLAAFIQACFVYALLQRRNALLAFAGSVAATSLGVVQWTSPTANWYSLSLAVVLVWWMVRLPVEHRARLLGAGILLGLLTLFRHLSGVWVAMAILVLALLERSSDGRGRQLVLARILLLTMLIALLAYLALSPGTGTGGVLLMAIWPAAILGWMLVQVRTRNGAAVTVVTEIAAGAIVPALPLIVYHLSHGSLNRWIADVVGAAAGETQMTFFGGGGWYAVLPLAGLYQAVSSASAVKIANGLYWAALPVLSAVNGALAVVQLRRHAPVSDIVLPVVASFYALVSLYLEGPLYLYYSVGLSLAGVLWWAAARSSVTRYGWATGAAALSVIAVVFHAGQSSKRTPWQILQGQRVTNTWTLNRADLERCSLRLSGADRETYGRFVDAIDSGSGAGESILALPNDAELYFLARRRSPVRFYNSALGIRNGEQLQEVVDIFTTRPPRLVVFRPDDKYNTDASRRIMELVRARFTRIADIDGAEVYRR